MRSSVAFLILTLGHAAACSRTPEPKPDAAKPVATTAASGAAPAPSDVPPPHAFVGQYQLPGAARMVAIGDIHGDLRALRAALRLAGATDSEDTWIGKGLTVVQTGDQLDRGNQDREVLDVIEKLEDGAKAGGGTFIVLNGNHELMNASFDFRYVTRPSFASFKDFASRAGAAAERVPEDERGRAAAFAPGAAYAMKLAKHLTVALVGDTLFAHGGVLPAHIDYGLARLNSDAQAFLAGHKPGVPKSLSAEDSPVWTRAYGGEDVDAGTCETLGRVLKEVGAKRLVVGHTVQKSGINSACGDRLFRIDVGLSSFYGDNPVQVLEITPQGTRVLKAGAADAAPAPSTKKSKATDSALHSAP